MFITINPLNAQEAYRDGSNRTDMQNYGVNKHWTINEKNMNHVLNTPKVDASTKVYDYAGIISDEEEAQMKNLIAEYIETTKMDMVFVTINMPYSNDEDNEDYAADFYDYNDFGLELEKYSGILLLRNAYSIDPYFDIYMFGNAQLYYVGSRSDYILDNIFVYFPNGQYMEGFKSFVSDCTAFYRQGVAPEMVNYYVDDDGYLHKDKGKFESPYGVMAIVGGLISWISVTVMKKKNNMVKAATNASDYFDKQTVKYNAKEDNFIRTVTTHHYISHDSGGSGGGGGFSSSSGSSGGGHSSGGGRHG